MQKPTQASCGRALRRPRTRISAENRKTERTGKPGAGRDTPQEGCAAYQSGETRRSHENSPQTADAKLNRHWRAAFLAALAETSNVTAAAAAAHVHPSRPYKVRRDEPDFARLWYGALLEGYENLEMEVLQRLRFGEGRDEGLRFDNGAALRLLGLHRETVARERALREDEDVVRVRASLEEKLDGLRQRIEARRTANARTSDAHTAEPHTGANGGEPDGGSAHG